jgi:hypothetical protein
LHDLRHPGGKSHQILEDTSGGGPHLMHARHREPVAPVPARGRLLDHVGPARQHAEKINVARRALRHTAPDRALHRALPSLKFGAPSKSESAAAFNAALFVSIGILHLIEKQRCRQP